MLFVYPSTYQLKWKALEVRYVAFLLPLSEDRKCQGLPN